MLRILATILALLLKVTPCAAQDTILLPPPPPAPSVATIEVCMLDSRDNLYILEAIYDYASDDTLVVRDGVYQSLSTAFPSTTQYAETTDWWRSNKLLRHRGMSYVRVGAPRILEVSALSKTNFRIAGVRLFSTNPAVLAPRSLFVPLRRGCVFQEFRRP